MKVPYFMNETLSKFRNSSRKLHVTETLTSSHSNNKGTGVSLVATGVGEDVRNSSSPQGEGVARGVATGDQEGGSWQVSGSGLSESHHNAGRSQLNHLHDVVDAGHSGRSGVDCRMVQESEIIPFNPLNAYDCGIICVLHRPQLKISQAPWSMC